MRDKIKARFKAMFPDVTLSNARLDAIADKLAGKITDETKIDEHLTSLNDVLPFSDIQKTDDKIRNLEAKKPATTPATTQDPATTPPAADEMPAWAKALLTEVQTLKATNTQQTIQQQLTGHEKLKTVPASYWGKRALPADPTQIDAFVAEVEADYTAFKQELVNQGLAVTTPPQGGTPAGSAASVAADIAAWAGKSETAK